MKPNAWISVLVLAACTSSARRDATQSNDRELLRSGTPEASIAEVPAAASDAPAATGVEANDGAPDADRASPAIGVDADSTLPTLDVDTTDERAVCARAKALWDESRELHASNRLQDARERAMAAIQWLATAPSARDSQEADAIMVELAIAVDEWGALGEAQAAWEWLVETRRRRTHAEDPSVLEAQTNLAAVLESAGDLRRAKEINAFVISVREKTCAPDDLDLLRSRGNQAAVLLQLGELATARALMEEVLEARERLLPDEDPELQTTRSNLAVVAKMSGDLRRARELGEHALAVCERTNQAESPRAQAIRMNLAGTLVSQGDLAGARVLLERVVSTLEARGPDDHPDLLIARMNTAIVARRLGDPARARELLEPVVRVWEATLPEDHPNLQNAWLNLSNAARDLDDFERSKEIDERILAARERSLSDDHPDLRVARANLAASLLGVGELQRARELFERVLASFEAEVHVDPQDEIGTRANLCRALARIHDQAALGEQLARLADDILDAFDRAVVMPEREARGAARNFQHALSPLLTHGDSFPTLLPRIFVAVESMRDHTLSRGVSSWPPDHPQVVLVRDLQRRVQQLAIDRWRSGRAADVEELFELARQRDAAEAELRRELVADRATRPRIEVEALARALPEGSCAIGFRQVTLWSRPQAPDEDEIGRAVLIALVLTRDGRVQQAELAKITELHEAVLTWRAAVGRPIDDLQRGVGSVSSVDSAAAPSEAAELESGERLRRLVLDPVLRLIGDAHTLFVCADDALHLVPLDALPLREGRVGDEFDVRVEASFGRLMSGTPPAGDEPALLVVGGVDFDARAKKGLPTPEPIDAAATKSSEDKPVPETTTSRWPLLPGTRVEAQYVESVFRAAFGRDVYSLLDGAASKDAFVDAASRATCIHVATHGWFATYDSGDAAGPFDRTSTFMSSVNSFAPMTRCGLAFAGANHDLRSAVLTAEELAGLDLSRCTLAVLSACETNVGFAPAGQGNQSLRAALHAAGVRTTITSLWNVPDAATAQLMRGLYQRVWVQGLPKDRALWEAKKELRDARNELGRPRFTTRDWAGWTLGGAAD